VGLTTERRITETLLYSKKNKFSKTYFWVADAGNGLRVSGILC